MFPSRILLLIPWSFAIEVIQIQILLFDRVEMSIE